MVYQDRTYIPVVLKFNPLMNTPSAIDPSVIKFAVALVIASAVIGIVANVSRGAAWVLILLVVTLLLIDNPVLIGFINLGSNSLSSSLK